MTLSPFVLSLGFAVAVLPLTAAAQTPSAASGSSRVVVTAASATAYSCAATTCKVVSELEKGAVVSVLKTDGEWHQVMVRTAANAMTTGWVKTAQVAVTSDTTTRMTGTERSDGIFRPSSAAPDATTETAADPRGCLTCLATRQPTADEWNAAMADAATRKAAPGAGRVATGLADGRTTEERMRDLFAERYAEELKRLSGMAASVDADLQSYLGACFQRFASIPVEGAAPRSTAVDDIIKAARATPGAARFALWSGTAAFAWNNVWAPQSNESSALPSCERIWEDARGRADRLKVDIEYLERDARDYDIYPGIVREMLATHGLAEPGNLPPSPPVTDIR